MGEDRGAGRSGGLLFAAVVVFLAYLVITSLAGVARLLLIAVLGVLLGLLAADVARRR